MIGCLKKEVSEVTGGHMNVNVKLLSRVRLFGTPWTVARQSPLSMGFSRQAYWSGLLSPPGDLSDPGMEPEAFVPPALSWILY